jgi:hypothetical protein
LIDTVYSPVKNGILPTPESSPETEEKCQTSKIGEESLLSPIPNEKSLLTPIPNEHSPLSPIPTTVLDPEEAGSSPSAAPLEKVSVLFLYLS